MGTSPSYLLLFAISHLRLAQAQPMLARRNLMTQQSAVRPNRRLSTRHRPKGCTKAACRKGTLDLGKDSALAILDIGENGMRLLVHERLNKDQEVAVTLEGHNHPRPLRVIGRVAWCLETVHRTFCVGVEFNKRLPYIELTRLA
jgi:PilZ domain